MGFGMTILNQSIDTIQNYTDSFTSHIKTKNVYEDIVNDVEKDLIHQTMKSVDHCLLEKTKK